jgi:acetamidase/formamidase
VRSLTAVNGWKEHKAAGVDVPDVMEQIYTAGCGAEAEGDRFPCGKLGPHLLTGPIAVASAEVGDILQVRQSTAGVVGGVRGAQTPTGSWR